MLGAIIGDIAGSRFEWHNIKTKDFELLSNLCSAALRLERELEHRAETDMGWVCDSVRGIFDCFYIVVP